MINFLLILMKTIKSNICVILSVIVILLIFGEGLYLIWSKSTPSGNLLNATIAVMVAIIGISLPITIGTVASRLSDYNNKYISNIFKKETTYKIMLYVVWLLVLALLLFMFFTDTTNQGLCHKIVGSIIVLIGIIAVINFYFFIKRVTDYIVDIDGTVFSILKADLKSMTSDVANIERQTEIIEIHAQIILRKISCKSYVEIKEIHESMSNTVIGIYDELHVNNGVLIDKLNQILNKYYSVVFKLWKESYKDSPETAKNILIDYERVLKHTIDERDDQYAFFIYQLITNEFQNKDSSIITFHKDSSWMWYFKIVHNPSFKIEYLERMNMQLFAIFKLIIGNGNKDIFDAFIGTCIDGMWNAKEYNFPDFNNTNIKQTELLSDIRVSIFRNKRINLEQINEDISTLNESDENKEIIREIAKEQYKYNSLQLLSAIIGAYCLFKKKNDYIETILFYNQPKNSNTRFANKDIVPDSIQTIINWYMDSYLLNKDYLILWDNHNDITVWFERYMGILICRIIEQTNKNHSYSLKNANKQELQHKITTIDNLKSIIGELKMEDYGLNKESKSKAKKRLDEILKEIKEEKEEKATNQELSIDKTTNFIKIVKDKINNSPIWTKALKNNSKNIEDAESFEFNAGFSQILDKSFLSESDSGMYFNFENSIARVVIDQIDFKVENRIRKKTCTDSESSINKNNFKTEILKLGNEYNVIFINYINIFDFLTTDEKFHWERKEQLIGKTGNGASIFSFGDPADTTKRMIIFKTKDISVINSENINIKIIDLNKDKGLQDEIIADQPYWLSNISQEDEEQRKFIQKQLQIDITGKFSFEISSKASITIIENL